MTLRILLLIYFTFSLTLLFGQERIWTSQSKISDIIRFEMEIDSTSKFLSKNVSLSKSYYPLLDKYPVTTPIIVQRKPIGYLPIYAEYFYTPSDSVIRLISYDWEKGKFGNLFDKQKMWKEESKNFDAYNLEYERILSILIPQLGTPVSSDTKAKEVSYEEGKYLARETSWETESIYAKMKMIFESVTYRIRLTIYWKK